MSAGAGMAIAMMQHEQIAPPLAADAVLHLTFRLGEEEYGIPLHKVQELRGYEDVIGIANVPDYIKGVVNLRGAIVPIVDMRIKSCLGTPSYDQSTVVIVLDIGERVLGVVVDNLSDVVTLTGEQITSPMNTDSSHDTSYLSDLSTVGQRMLLLADIERLMSGADGIFVKVA